MAYTMASRESLVFMCAFATLANCAKADIEYAQEHQGTGEVCAMRRLQHGVAESPLFRLVRPADAGVKRLFDDELDGGFGPDGQHLLGDFAPTFAATPSVW